jgi:antitoxin component YwqK of YwqJK toxin-antitoxin module
MKFVAVFVSIFGWGVCFGQGVRFKLYRTGPCTTIEQLDTAYSLYKVPYLDTGFFPKQGIVYLPHVGKYRIYFVEGPFTDTTVDIRDTGLFVFRYTEPDFALYSGGLDQAPAYRSCRILINGYFETFYPNGKIMIRGDFFKGYPKDSLVRYYANGGLKSRERIFEKESDIEEFDSLSRRISITHNQNGSIISYRGYKSTEFFADGSIKLKETQINSIHTIKEYYPSGQLKINQTSRRRTEYLENGYKKVVFKWRKKLELFEPHQKGIHDYTIRKVEYDGNGRILQIAVYEVWRNSWLPPPLELEKADWLVSLKKFKEGKEVYSVNDINMKDYKK